MNRQAQGVSLSRTTGKRASRIIFSSKNEAPIESKKKVTDLNDRAMTDDLLKDYRNENSLKARVDSYFNQVSTKPAGISSNTTSHLYGQSTGTSNFGRKIVAKRDSMDESTRDETKITRSSYYSKYENSSKLLFS